MKLETIAILTCNTPKQLSRCIESFVSNARSFDRKMNFVVSDDSRDPRMRQQNVALLQEHVRVGTPIRYIGFDEKQEFVNRLQSRVPVSTDLLQFMIGNVDFTGYRDGGNRNSLFLEMAGEVFFSSDDDIVCRVSSTESAPPAANAVFSGDPSPVTLYPNQESLLADQKFIDTDFLALHERVLGSEPEPGATIRVSSCGYYGDCGIRTPAMYLWTSDKMRDQLIQDPDQYEKLVLSRQILKSPRQYSVTPGSHFQSVVAGLDARQAPAPFVPVMRGSDLLFGLMFRKCFPNDRMAYLPYALHHAPLKARVNQFEGMMEEANRCTLGDLFKVCIGSYSPSPDADSSDRLVQLGRHLNDCGNLTAKEFGSFLDGGLRQPEEQTLQYLEGLLARFNSQPDFWARDILKFIEVARANLSSSHFYVPTDAGDLVSALETTQKILRHYGELLQSWPTIFLAAKALKTEGHRMSRAL